MNGTMMTHGASVHHTHSASTSWIPRAVRCGRCQELAREEVRERVNEDEIVVRYGCPVCRWHQTRHYHEEIESDTMH